MRLTLVAVGRLKAGPERELFQRYWSRVEAGSRALGLAPVTLVEIAESRGRDAKARKSEEGRRVAEAAKGADVLVALDEAGRRLDSRAFAGLIGARRDAGASHLAFCIGGPDGQDESLLGAAHLRLSLGAMTLPHGLARIVLAEQFYRATTILAGHPYHRG